MPKADYADAEVLRQWMDEAIADPCSESGVFVWDDLPYLRKPPASWTPASA